MDSDVPLGSSKRSFAVDGVTQGINDTAKKLLTDRNVDDGTSTLDDVTFLDQLVVTEHDNTNVVRLQVESHTLRQGNQHCYFNNMQLKGISVIGHIKSGEKPWCWKSILP